ncbi:NAD(P)-dependent dehydrogenase, short-chain alcohol dehydrogenase family [Oryzisolibacter propanilivorax]|uniref:NAD(P)-dependent dehydrogenase, short-chain alcohol dehydrogenase family n=1 Tax=Oryzisolibacter propanilivorax TaxID=1527607 RepID=A0A1G9VHW6_9BURK|nr:SDR family oxidoreductase [Oryzisolibacter propanilivorax]SDM71774.1 NAD(P)-dependent dehydrogenase, short-chain alcohol dehydrogenase family [Oryzisolibacter propanilivorax]
MPTALVIGASRGIGLEFVRQYREAGWRVLATVRGDEGRARVQALGAQALTVDVADPASISGLTWQLDGERLDVALYVAGVMRRPDARTPPTREDFDAVMHANVLGAMQALPQVAPMVEAAGGVFAFLSSSMSQIGAVPASNAWLYRTSKAALNMAVAAAQHDYPAATLVTIDPGWVQTDMGGGEAPLTVQASVQDMRQVLATLAPEDKGRLLHHDGRRAATW